MDTLVHGVRFLRAPRAGWSWLAVFACAVCVLAPAQAEANPKRCAPSKKCKTAKECCQSSPRLELARAKAEYRARVFEDPAIRANPKRYQEAAEKANPKAYAELRRRNGGRPLGTDYTSVVENTFAIGTQAELEKIATERGYGSVTVHDPPGGATNCLGGGISVTAVVLNGHRTKFSSTEGATVEGFPRWSREALLQAAAEAAKKPRGPDDDPNPEANPLDASCSEGVDGLVAHEREHQDWCAHPQDHPRTGTSTADINGVDGDNEAHAYHAEAALLQRKLAAAKARCEKKNDPCEIPSGGAFRDPELPDILSALRRLRGGP